MQIVASIPCSISLLKKKLSLLLYNVYLISRQQPTIALFCTKTFYWRFIIFISKRLQCIHTKRLFLIETRWIFYSIYFVRFAFFNRLYTGWDFSPKMNIKRFAKSTHDFPIFYYTYMTLRRDLYVKILLIQNNVPHNISSKFYQIWSLRKTLCI